MPAGRPSLYDPKYCDEIIEYFNKEPFINKIRIKTFKDGSTEEIPYKDPVELPTLVGFACKIGVNRDSILEWSKVHPEFSGAIMRAKDNQERILVTNGLMSLYQAQFAQFTALNLINWRNKQETELSGSVGVEVTEIQRKIIK